MNQQKDKDTKTNTNELLCHSNNSVKHKNFKTRDRRHTNFNFVSRHANSFQAECVYTMSTFLLPILLRQLVGRVAQSVWRLTTGWTVRGSNPRGGQDFQHLSRPAPGPSLLYNGYRDLPRGKERPGRDADPSPSSSAVVMKG